MRARYELCLGPRSRHIYRALLAEARQAAPQRGTVRVELRGDCIVIEVHARDISSLRAISNSFLLLARAAAAAVEAAQQSR